MRTVTGNPYINDLHVIGKELTLNDNYHLDMLIEFLEKLQVHRMTPK